MVSHRPSGSSSLWQSWLCQNVSTLWVCFPSSWVTLLRFALVILLFGFLYYIVQPRHARHVTLPRLPHVWRRQHLRLLVCPPFRTRLRVCARLPTYRRPPRWGCLPWKWLRVRRISLTRQHLHSRILRYITRCARTAHSPCQTALHAIFSPYVRRHLVAIYHTYSRCARPTSGGQPFVHVMRANSLYLVGGLPFHLMRLVLVLLK